MLGPMLAGMLAKEHQRELLRTARAQRIELGFAQSEEGEILAVEREHVLAAAKLDEMSSPALSASSRLVQTLKRVGGQLV